MPTTPSNSTVNSSWVRFRSVAYLTGRGLSWGCPGDLFPRAAFAPGKYSVNVDIAINPTVAVIDGDVKIFADESFDHLVVGYRLQESIDPAYIFRQLVWKLKVGGHVVVYLPNDETPGLRFKFDRGAVETLLSQTGAWKIKGEYVKDNRVLVIAKKITGHKGTIVHLKPPDKPRACIVRYGALGDMVMITPLIHKLHDEGYEVTMNITPYAMPILENNPYVDNYVFQEREAIPNNNLGQYWDTWRGEYDKYINLSESIEGSLLKVEGRKEFFTTQSWRHETCNKNYYDYTMSLGGYNDYTGTRGELYFTPQEQREAKKFRDEHRGKFLILWGLNGSSHHKVYPLMQVVVDQWLKSHPDTVIVTVGDERAQTLEYDHPNIIHAAGLWPLRKVMALVPLADCAIGPESILTNISGCFDTPKITFLSHSTHENLCKYWKNDFCLAPDRAFAPCYPCHQLHYTLESCPIVNASDTETGEELSAGPACIMGAISPDRVVARLEEVYSITHSRSLSVV
jgi:ADP-heptose:LPS heptosyltransferase